MPTYQYACTECGHGFEAVQSFSDAALTDCPECTGRLRKVFNSVGIVFKGSGFYRTDSREKTGTAGAAKSGEKSESSGTSEPASKSDKPAPAKASSDTSTGAKSATSGGSSTSSSSTAGSAA